MQLSSAPAKVVLPFANAGGKSTIPVASQIGITPGAASFTDGFPPLTRTPVASGGIPPSGLDMNGIMFDVSAIVRWANAGAGYVYDSTFATDSNVGGYPQGALVLRSDGTGYWLSVVDNNVTNPESSPTGWVPGFTTGNAPVTMTNANVTLTPLQYGKPIIIITGVLTANVQLVFPNIADQWTVINATTGAFTISCKTASGTGVSVSGTSILICDGANVMRLVGSVVTNPTRLALTINTIFYISTSGNDTTGNGTIGNPWATIQHAHDYIVNSIDLAGFNATILLNSTGTYQGVQSLHAFVGGGPNNVIIQGNIGSQATTIITSSTGDTLNATGAGAGFTYQYVTLTNSAGTGFACVHAQNGGTLLQGTGVILGSAGGSTGAYHFLCSTLSLIQIMANYTISGGAYFHYICYPSANISTYGGLTITVTGTPAFNTFAFVAGGALVFSIVVPVFSGSATGFYYQVSANGLISTNGSPSNYLPGSGAAGTPSSSGGQYV